MSLTFAVTNIANNQREIIVFHRMGRELRKFTDKTFYPYFFQPSSTGMFKTIDGKRVNKVVCARPSDVSKKRDEDSYEADVLFVKRYLLDKISSFGKAELKYSFIDIEVMCPELPNYKNPIYPISCISCSNSYEDSIEQLHLPFDGVKGDFSEEAEKMILNQWVKWIREQQFDLLLGWNFIEFDYKYLCARYNYLFGVNLAEMLSPINQSRYLAKVSKDEEETLVPAGLSLMDYMDFYKKIYRTEVSYALDAISQKYLQTPPNEKVDFNTLSKEIIRKNICDVQKLMNLEKKFKLVDYYDELRRMSMCEWTDVTWNSKMLDMILLREARAKGLILPSKKHAADFGVEETFEGAYRRCDTGLFKNLHKVDLSSAYPMSIIDFCLDIGNIKPDGIDINGTKFYQNTNALLPSIAQKLINKKDTLKKQLKVTDPASAEYQDLHTKYDAIKAVVNSLFGVCGLKIFRLFDIRVAGAITFLVRDLLHYVEDELAKRDMKVVYTDTDSLFIDAKENPVALCNELVQQWAKEKYGKENVRIEFDYEGVYEKIFVIALCHYKGYLRKKSGLEEEKKGLEMKRADSSEFIKKFQEELLNRIMNEETQESIVSWINEQKEYIQTLPLKDVAFPCKINAEQEYASPPIFIRGLEYTKELVPTFNKRPGDTFYHIPVKPFGKAIRKSSRMKKNKETGVSERQYSETEVDKDVLCFDENEYAHIKDVDWDSVIRKSITKKVETIFEAMKWNLDAIKEVKEKKVRVKKEKESIFDKKMKDPEFKKVYDEVSLEERLKNIQIHVR